jgi:cyclic pyranopterin phosphate synthase
VSGTARKPASPSRKKRLSHVRADGSLRMVDTSAKPATARIAIAEAVVRMAPAARQALKAGSLKKGDALAAARIAGVFAAKRTAELIPLCHPIALTDIDVATEFAGRDRVRITCSASCVGPTGVEMEALTGAAIAALTIYDMCKAMDRAITIESVRLLEKAGGASGRWRR